ncbi:relaxase/mobilization nuclease domain-containing protein [Polaromonas sp.]|uniref:relaxase/mobilization nuclease domain-containing protein n=1 Tax=Polaromonas sp. TaxID=1869339 RepID=UPI003BA91377
MVPKITVGAGLRGALEYDQSSKDGALRAEWVVGTLVGTPREMAAQAGHFRALRPDCKKPVWRCSISLPPSDGRQTLQKWESIATDFLREMGIPQNAAWCAIRHFERDHDHIHLTVLRALPDGSLWKQEHSARRAIKACEKLEQVHNLSTHSRTPAPKERPSRAEIEISNRKGTPMSRELIQDSVNSILQANPKGIDFTDLQKLLVAKGVDIQPYAPGGVLRGVSYSFDGFKWPGSKIGREFSAGLPERGVRYSVGTEKASTADILQAPELGLGDANSSAPSSRREADQDPYDRAPAMVRGNLKNNFPQNRVRSLGSPPDIFTARKPLLDLQKLQAVDVGPLSKSLLILGGALINVGAEVVLKIVEFIKRLLLKLGIGLRPSAFQTYEHPAKVPLVYEPVMHAEALPLAGTSENVDDVAQKVLDVVDAIALKNTDLLPAGEGREELVKALQKEFLAGGAIGASASDPFAEMFSSAPESDQTGVSVTPRVSALEGFKTALATLKNSDTAVNKARVKDLPIFFDMRKKSNAELDAAVEKFRSIDSAFKKWKSENRVTAALGLDPLGYKKKLSDALAERNHYRSEAESAVKKNAAFTALESRTPEPQVPPQILAAREAAVAAARQAKTELDASISLIVKRLRVNVMLTSELAQIESDLKLFERRFSRVLIDSNSDKNFSVDFEEVLQQVSRLKRAEDSRTGTYQVDAEADGVEFDGPRG